MKISNFNNPGSIVSIFLLITVFFVFFSTNPVFSQSKIKMDKGIPLHVISDKMVAQRDTSMVEFIGNVKVTRQDHTILADSIKIYLTQDDEAQDNNAKDDTPKSSVKKIVSMGNVRYTQGDRRAFADKAVYTTKDEILVLTGKSPKLITGSSFVTGKKITVFRKQDKVIVESSGTKRVEAVFNPEDKPAKQ